MEHGSPYQHNPFLQYIKIGLNKGKSDWVKVVQFNAMYWNKCLAIGFPRNQFHPIIQSVYLWINEWQKHNNIFIARKTRNVGNWQLKELLSDFNLF